MSAATNAYTVSTYAGREDRRPPLTGFGKSFRLFVARFLELRERRDAFRSLLRLDARLLSDIGVTREDIEWASRLPLSVNASAELQKIAKERRG